MSVAGQGSGWWQASDGRWYPPDVHPWQQGAAPAPVVRPSTGPDTVRSRPMWASSDDTTATAPSSPETIRVDMPPSFLRRRTSRADPGEPTTVVVPDPTPPAAPPTGWGASSSAPLVGRSATAPGADEAMRSYLDPTIAAAYKEPPPDPDIAAGVLGLAAAAILAIGSFLVWADASGPVTGSVDGLGGSNGWGTLGSGVVVAVCAALVLTGRRSAPVGAVMVLAGLAAVLSAAYSAVDILRADDELAQMLIDAGVDRVAANAASLDLTAGFAVVAVGAVAALIAGGIAFARRL